MIKDSGHREPMGDTGFVRDTHYGKGRMDLLPWYAIMELSKHCEEGALKYGERNIDKGAPLHSLLDSGARHLAKVMAGETDEDHLPSPWPDGISCGRCSREPPTPSWTICQKKR